MQSGKVIFINGSCSSGKSTLAQHLAQGISAQYFAFDEIVIPAILKKLLKKHIGLLTAIIPQKFFLNNFFALVSFLSDHKKYHFQKKFYTELKNGIALEPTIQMYKKVREQALQGHNVIIEAPLHLGNGVDCLSSLSALKDLDVTLVLAYCPWNNIIERIEKRNNATNKANHRELNWALINFIHCFNISTKLSQNPLETIHMNTIQSCIDKYADKRYKKTRLHVLEETKNTVFEIFKEQENYYVYPTLIYDLIINTAHFSTEHASTMITDFINKHMPRGEFKKNIPAACIC